MTQLRLATRRYCGDVGPGADCATVRLSINLRDATKCHVFGRSKSFNRTWLTGWVTFGNRTDRFGQAGRAARLEDRPARRGRP